MNWERCSGGTIGDVEGEAVAVGVGDGMVVTVGVGDWAKATAAKIKNPLMLITQTITIRLLNSVAR